MKVETITLRPAVSLDAEIVFEWRNAPETRRYSFDPSPLNKLDHIKWFEQSLKMHNRYLLIAEQCGNPVGVLRYDLVSSQAEISIYVSPALSGKGLGTKILLAGTDWIKLNLPEIKILRGKVLANNIASARVFDKAGFNLKMQVYEKDVG
ncbi:MAG: GNAT family N-acetyltransferase [Gammaproteobacteria bacterium]|nr:GNAT family N-acetyltransferase [Gammaproteobacteria bacterium]